MTRPLAVFVPILGVTSETFIRRHLHDVLPGRTVAITDRADGPLAASFGDGIPTLELRTASRSLVARVVGRVARRLGVAGGADTVAIGAFAHTHGVRVLLGEYLDVSHRLLAVARRLRLSFFVHGHGYDLSLKLRDGTWRTRYKDYAQADGVIVPAAFMRERLLELGLPESRVHVIPYGVVVPASGRVHGEAAPVRCLAVGRMVGKKAPLLLLEAFALAHARNRGALELDYVGDGKLLAAAQRFVEERSLSGVVRLHGALPPAQVQELMVRADLFVQHSVVDPDTGDEEGLPVAILEAMAHGLPVVSTRHAGIPEAVLEGTTGLLGDERDTSTMADHLTRLVNDVALRGFLGGAGRVRAIERYSVAVQRSALVHTLGLEGAST